MARKLADWLTAYLAYTADTESAPIFNKWVGISTIASALRKKTWLQVGRLKVYPNLYIVLVADPGVARKSQAISYATNLISEVPAIFTSADSGSAQGLIETLADYTSTDVVGQEVIHHASVSVISREFESFLSNVGGNKLMVTLTDLYDAGEKPWKHRTKQTGVIIVPSVYLNILGATTPESLGSSLSSLVFGGGLASRITFVCSEQKTKKVPFPQYDDKLKDLEQDLVNDLREISRMAGALEFSPDAKKFWSDWYMNYEENSPSRIQPRKEFNGWYSRKPTLIQKLATILAASEHNNGVVVTTNLMGAIILVEEVERGMGIILNEVVSKSVARKTETLEQLIKEYGQISEKHLLQLTWRDIDEDTFDALMEPLIKSMRVRRVYESPDGRAEIWYRWEEQ